MKELHVFAREDIIGDYTQIDAIPEELAQSQSEGSLPRSDGSTYPNREGSFCPIAPFVSREVATRKLAGMVEDLVRMAMLICPAVRVRVPVIVTVRMRHSAKRVDRSSLSCRELSLSNAAVQVGR
jgi:hypothetical protein